MHSSWAFPVPLQSVRDKRKQHVCRGYQRFPHNQRIAVLFATPQRSASSHKGSHRCGGPAPSKSLTLPHGRATEHSDAQVSSPRVSKGCASCYDLQDFDGALGVARILTNLRACGMISPIYANILTGACRILASFTDSE